MSIEPSGGISCSSTNDNPMLAIELTTLVELVICDRMVPESAKKD
jgi:hypothetical protein